MILIALPKDDLEGEAGSGPGRLRGSSYRSAYVVYSSEDLRCDLSDILDPGFGTTGNSSSESPPHPGTHKERRDLDGGADALWSLYGKEAKAYDEAEFLSLAADMDGVLVFVNI